MCTRERLIRGQSRHAVSDVVSLAPPQLLRAPLKEYDIFQNADKDPDTAM
jgi:hypothetical protein